MSQILRIPFDKEFLSELEDAFIGKDEDASDFIWREIRRLCKDAKIGKLNKVCVVNILQDGKQISETLKLKDVTLEETTSDPEWIPNLHEKEDVTHYEHSITETTMNYLKLFGSFTILRHEKWAKSIIKENDKMLQRMRKDPKTEQTVIDDAIEAFNKNKQMLDDAKPKCLEDAIYSSIFSNLYKHVSDNIDTMLDKENEAANPKEEKPIPAK